MQMRPSQLLQQPPEAPQLKYARRQSRFWPRYSPVQPASAAAAEADSNADGQLKLQVVLALTILTLFVAAFLAVVCLLLLKPLPAGYLLLEPRSHFGAPRVEVDPANAEAMSLLLSRLTQQISHASIRVWLPRLSRGRRRPRDCAREQRYPGDDETCVPSVAEFGPCNAYAAFGYLRGDPCILVKAGPQLAGNYSENPRIACSATDEAGANLSLTYHPTMRHLARSFAYFPRYFFPYATDSQFYLPPLVMVQLRRPPSSALVSVRCWLDNSAFANASTSAHLQLRFK